MMILNLLLKQTMYLISIYVVQRTRPLLNTFDSSRDCMLLQRTTMDWSDLSRAFGRPPGSSTSGASPVRQLFRNTSLARAQVRFLDGHTCCLACYPCYLGQWDLGRETKFRSARVFFVLIDVASLGAGATGNARGMSGWWYEPLLGPSLCRMGEHDTA